MPGGVTRSSSRARIHSVSRASSVTNKAPVSNIRSSISVMPEVMNVPNPPAPTKAARVALPMTSIAAERTPVTMTGQRQGHLHAPEPLRSGHAQTGRGLEGGRIDAAQADVGVDDEGWSCQERQRYECWPPAESEDRQQEEDHGETGDDAHSRNRTDDGRGELATPRYQHPERDE